MDHSPAAQVYEFSGFRLDTGHRTVADPQGRRVPLKPKVFDTLLYLVEHRGELLDKRQLLQAIWPNVIVEENNLNQHISTLRKIFKEKPDEHRFIVTEPGRGFRFVAEVNLARRARADRSVELPELDSALASIAILPFKMLGAVRDSLLEHAIPLELSSLLSRTNRLRVVSSQSSFAHSRDQIDLPTLASELQVQYVISGTVLEADDRVRIIAELYQVAEDRVLWSESYDIEGGKLLETQQEIAESIAAAFGGERLRTEIERSNASSNADLDAWRLVQRARAYLLDYRPELVTAAIPLLHRAIESAPGYAPAHATLGLVVAEQTLNAISADPKHDRALARNAAMRAEELAPRDPVVLRGAGAVQAYCGDYRLAIELLRRAIAHSPYDLGSWGYLGWPLVATGSGADLAELHGILDRLLRLAPKHPGRAYWLFHKSVAHACEDDCASAVDLARESTQLQPRFALGWLQLANLQGRLDRAEAAQAALNRATAVNARFTVEYYIALMQTLTDQPDVIHRRCSGLHALAAPARS